VFLAFAVTVGLAYTVGAPPPRSAATEIPPWLIEVCSTGLLVHGLTGLAAAFVPMRLYRALLVEAGSMLIGAGVLVVFAAAAFAYSGWVALMGGGLFLAWAIANVVRAVQIRRDFWSLP
jgi:hypothetical protein